MQLVGVVIDDVALVFRQLTGGHGKADQSFARLHKFDDFTVHATPPQPRF